MSELVRGKERWREGKRDGERQDSKGERRMEEGRSREMNQEWERGREGGGIKKGG